MAKASKSYGLESMAIHGDCINAGIPVAIHDMIKQSLQPSKTRDKVFLIHESGHS